MAHPGDLLAVICADSGAADLMAAGTDQHVRIVPVSQTRGLEFDAFIVIDPPQITAAHSGGERDLYVALTRATKRLCTITVQPNVPPHPLRLCQRRNADAEREPGMFAPETPAHSPAASS